MNHSMQPIMQHLFQASALEDISRERLESFVEEYPCFGFGHYLLSRKLRAESAGHYLEETHRTSLYFSNPFWLHWLLENTPDTGDKKEDAASAPAAFEPVTAEKPEPVMAVASEPFTAAHEETYIDEVTLEETEPQSEPQHEASAQSPATEWAALPEEEMQSAAEEPATVSPADEEPAIAGPADEEPATISPVSEEPATPHSIEETQAIASPEEQAVPHPAEEIHQTTEPELSAAELLLNSIEEARVLRESLQKLNEEFQTGPAGIANPVGHQEAPLAAEPAQSDPSAVHLRAPEPSAEAPGGLPPRSAEALREGEQAKPGQDNRLQMLEQNDATHTRRALFLGLTALGIIFLLLYLLFRNKEKATSLRNRQNDHIEALNAQLALANETKVKLFSIIGRDLRSPASQIVHWLQLQKENPGLFDEEARLRHQEKVTTAAQNVLQTMEDLLLWSQSLRLHFTPQLTPTDLSAVVRKELNFLQQRIREKGLRISTDIPHDFLPLTDESFVSVIIRNLLQNAIRHSNEGSTILIRAGGSDLRITNPSPLIDTRALNALLHDRAMDGSSSGLGLKIANDLAAVIHTEIVFTRSADGYLTALLSWKG